jgi:TonB family protein
MKRLVVLLLVAGCSHAPPPAAKPVAQAPAAAPAPVAKPAADEEMQVAGTLGTLADEEIAAPIQRRWDEITACFTDAKSKLWYLDGRVELKFRVTHSGEPKSVYVSASNIGSWDVERCILTIARELRFSKPHGGGEAEFTYPIEFRGKAALATWDEARVAPLLKKPKPRKDLHECRQKGRMPSSLTMTMYVAPGGKVTSAGLSADAPIDEQLAQCLVAKAQLWRLEDPLGKIAKATAPLRD